MAPFYTATDLTLGVELLGDASGDGMVDAGDYTLWANGFAMAEPSYSDGDLTRNGLVNAADYTIWANQFRTEVLGPRAMPKPSTLVRPLIGAVVLVYRRPQR